MNNACIVVPLFFAKRRRTFNSPADVLELAMYTVDVYKNLDTGLHTDIIFVNNSPEEETGSDYLNTINNTEAFNGKFVVIEGDNLGMSFGAHNTAFNKFQNQYDFWCFTEDDIIYTHKNFLSVAFDQFKNDSSVGFVSACGIESAGSENEHAHGGVGCTTNDTLLRVVDMCGYLPHSRQVANLTDGRLYKKEQIMKGEVAFTSCYRKMGLKVVIIECCDMPFIRWDKSDSDVLNKIDERQWGYTRSVH